VRLSGRVGIVFGMIHLFAERTISDLDMDNEIISEGVSRRNRTQLHGGIKGTALRNFGNIHR